MTRPHADRLAGPCRCRKPTGNFCADSKNIGSNTPIPAVTLTRDGAASKAPAAVTRVTTECAGPARVRWSRLPC